MFKICVVFVGYYNINFIFDWGYWCCFVCFYVIKIFFVVDIFGNFVSWYLYFYGLFGNGKRVLCSYGLLCLYYIFFIFGN